MPVICTGPTLLRISRSQTVRTMPPEELLEQKQAEKQEVKGYFETTGFDPVSYTHLTLPTILLV